MGVAGDKFSRVVTLEDVKEADFNLSPSLFVETNDKKQHRNLSAIITDLKAASEARQKADAELSRILSKLSMGSS